MTIPTLENEGGYNKLYAMSNVLFGPLVSLVLFNDIVDLKQTVGYFFGIYVPLWGLIVFQGAILASAFYVGTPHAAPPPWLDKVFVALAFVASISWISMSAQELLGCLTTMGTILGFSPAILGVTVLAWGNSVGDLVADTAMAKAGEPQMAVSGCYAGPLFNTLIGLGLAFLINTSKSYPHGYKLHYHPNVSISFGFLFAILIGSAAAVPMSDYRITKPWGLCLIAFYCIFTVVTVLVEAGVIGFR